MRRMITMFCKISSQPMLITRIAAQISCPDVSVMAQRPMRSWRYDRQFAMLERPKHLARGAISCNEYL